MTENTIVLYLTDNGPMVCLFPDSGHHAISGEKNTGWDGGWRVPALVRWPERCKPGTVFSEIFAGEDWLPTLLAAAGEPTSNRSFLRATRLADELTKSTSTATTRRDHLAGKGPGKRKEFFYFSDDGDLLAVRYERLKIHFLIQEAKGIEVWRRPFTALRAPIFFDLAIDPFERGDEGMNYNDWWYRRAFIAAPGSEYRRQDADVVQSSSLPGRSPPASRSTRRWNS